MAMAGSILSGSVALLAQGGYPDLVKLDAEFLEFESPRWSTGSPIAAPRRWRPSERVSSVPRTSPRDRCFLMERSGEGGLPSGLGEAERPRVRPSGDEALGPGPHPLSRRRERDPVRSKRPFPRRRRRSSRRSSKTVPKVMAQAQNNLTEANGELAKLDDLLSRELRRGRSGRALSRPAARRDHRVVSGPVRTAGKPHADLVARLSGGGRRGFRYRDWLRRTRPDAAVRRRRDGELQLVPEARAPPSLRLGGSDLLGERELHRYRLNYVVDRNRNRNLPELDLTKTREQHEERTREAEEQIRAMVSQQKLMTIPGTSANRSRPTFS